MDKKTLMQHKALQKEIPKLKKELDKLQQRLEEVPVVSGKVTKSSDDFPYIEEHVTVQIQEPHEADEIKKQIRIKEQRLLKAERDRTEIEEFIASIPISEDRQIFELTVFEGKKQREVSRVVGYSQGRISQIIGDYLKD